MSFLLPPFGGEFFALLFLPHLGEEIFIALASQKKIRYTTACAQARGEFETFLT